jgi:dTDP-4-dehydrorhamnose reductase
VIDGQILLFGANGQLGRELTDRALEQAIPLRVILHSEADIAEADAVERTLKRTPISVVVNAAAYTKVDQAESEPYACFRSNAIGPGVLARACRDARVPLVHISSDYVFDGSKAGAYNEDDPVSPLGVYGRSKAEGEVEIRQVLDQHIIIRTSWVYGPYGANFLKTMLRLARERDRIEVVADQRGCPTATIDLANAILGVSGALTAGNQRFGTYHFAGSGATTWHGFACAIMAAQAPFTGRRPAIVPIATSAYPRPAKRPINSELDSARFAATFGVQAADWRTRTIETVSALLKAG